MIRPWWQHSETVVHVVIWLGGSFALGWHLAKAIVERLG